MIPKSLLVSTPVELPEMLDAREHRQQIQQRLLNQFGCPLISFTMNIVGEHKVFPLQIRAYSWAVEEIKNQCNLWALTILCSEEIRENTGYECFFVVDASPLKIKEILCKLEENSPIGRLFDIDVIRLDGTKVSRQEVGLEERRCLLCDAPAFQCARSRTHSVAELWEREVEMIWDFFCADYASQVAKLAKEALLLEVNATPKPGLVDRNNTGAHKDMDICTFQRSAAALEPFFEEFVRCGIEHCQLAPSEIFPLTRPIGIQAEQAMLSATDGVNTHKGIIFSLGILTASLGYLFGNQMPYSQQKLRDICTQMTVSLGRDFDHLTAETAVTNGEKLYVKYGIRGIRGEAMDGYPALFDIAIPQLNRYLQEGYSQNDSGILALLHIIANTEDSNIIARSSYEEMLEIQRELADYLSGDQGDYLKFLQDLDEKWITRNISPGGSADLLALSYFVGLYEGR